VTIIRLWPFAVLIAFAFMFLGFIAFEYMVAGEEICLDRHPWWGPPNDPNVYTSCSGHIYERMHKRG
jgi:hypothetical protein